MGIKEVEAFLSKLRKEPKVSAATHNQALSILLFLYREVLGQNLPQPHPPRLQHQAISNFTLQALPWKPRPYWLSGQVFLRERYGGN